MNPEWLVIDKLDCYNYFDNMEEVAKFLDLTKSETYAMYCYCKRKYVEYSSRGFYIQRLFNHPEQHQPKNTEFYFDWRDRKKFNRKNNYWNKTLKMTA